MKQATSPPEVVVPLLLLPKDLSRILNVNVGVLGHVDSGKTSLVKRLSTLLSTAALDKHPQSRERGITLDLGFSAFFIQPPLSLQGDYDCVQITLVDCPGHSSLIRTIIGGAQIIDMVLLVVDATKGIQAQTTECLVIAEITTEKLIVVLNKIDLFSPDTADQRTRQVIKNIQNALFNTKFRDAPIAPIAAAVGGEKVAAAVSAEKLPSTNIHDLLQVLKSHITLPRRDNASSDTSTPTSSGNKNNNFFHFAIDHCFPIKGKGTVLTGTVVSGSAQVNDTIHFPEYNMERKIKSIQMFKRPTVKVKQGDRCGICVASLDSTLIERGIAAKPQGYISYIESAICLVQKVRFFLGGELRTDTKFHMSVGHATVMATIKFFGAKELLLKATNNQRLLQATTSPLLFDFDQDYLYQDRLIEKFPSNVQNKELFDDNVISDREILPTQQSFAAITLENNNADDCGDSSLLNWAIVDFHSPVFCPLNSLVIGSRLDTDVSNINSGTNPKSSSINTNNTCRLAFHGRIIQKFDPKIDASRLKIYNWKEKKGTLQRFGDAHRRSSDQQIVRYEVYGSGLFKPETKMNLFVGMKVTADGGDIGVIRSSFGTEGKFKVYFPAGTTAKEGSELVLRFKRFANDPKKGMHQDIVLPDDRSGTKIETVKKSKMKKANNSKKMPSSAINNNANKIAVTSSNNNLDSNNSIDNGAVSISYSGAPANDGTTSSQLKEDLMSSATIVAYGEISKYKQDSLLPDGQHYSVAIVDGLFTPDINIKEKYGMKVIILDTREEGIVSGSFGKMGKCKVSFEHGSSAPEGSKVYLSG